VFLSRLIKQGNYRYTNLLVAWTYTPCCIRDRLAVASLRVTGTTFTTMKSGLPPQTNGLSFYTSITVPKHSFLKKVYAFASSGLIFIQRGKILNLRIETMMLSLSNRKFTFPP